MSGRCCIDSLCASRKFFQTSFLFLAWISLFLLEIGRHTGHFLEWERRGLKRRKKSEAAFAFDTVHWTCLMHYCTCNHTCTCTCVWHRVFLFCSLFAKFPVEMECRLIFPLLCLFVYKVAITLVLYNTILLFRCDTFLFAEFLLTQLFGSVSLACLLQSIEVMSRCQNQIKSTTTKR